MRSAFDYFQARSPAGFHFDQAAPFDAAALLVQFFQLLDVAGDDVGWQAQIDEQMPLNVIHGLH